MSRGDPTRSIRPWAGRRRAPRSTRCACGSTSYAYNHGKLELAPVLAAALPALSKDKLSYTVQLRQGIQFNDGTPFNAQAVVTTVQRFITYPGSLRASDYAGVDSVTATGPYTVVFHLKQRDSTLQRRTCTCSRRRRSRRRARASPRTRSASGPFMFDHRVVGDNVTLIKSPYYYDQERRLPRQDRLQADARRGRRGGGARGGRHPGARPGLDRRSCRRVQQNSSLRVLQAPQLGWAGHHDQHRQPQRRRQPAVRERGHAARAERRSCGRRSRRRSTARR